MPSQLFVAELPVVDRDDARRRGPELAHLAEQWFCGPVTLVSEQVSLRDVDGTVRYVVTATFAALPAGPPPGGMERAARWLGLAR